ncbi:rNA polymerase sigma factor sigma-70 family [Firmicutes bacterium CAG:822]|nr:rNA polymerase sigma factor sigma-70 family [Firmicutes bacterium CAG:822]
MNYDEINDYEVLSMVADNEDATELLFKKYKPLIVGLAKKIYNNNQNTGFDLNDLIQEGMIGFSTAINTFDENKDTTFFTYAKTCIERRLISLIKSASRLKHQILNESYSVEDLAQDNKSLENLLEDSTSNPENKIIDDENTNELIRNIQKQLTPLESAVFELKISGFTYREIADILDKDSKSIDNAISRIKTKVQKYLEK